MTLRHSLTKQRYNENIDLGLAVFYVLGALGALTFLPRVLGILGVVASVGFLVFTVWEYRVASKLQGRPRRPGYGRRLDGQE